VVIRDNFRCQYCGKELKEVADYEMDHVMPRISGGKDNYQNLVASCVKCARLKSNHSPQDVGLPIPQAMPFHSAQALFLLKTNDKIREKWLSLFPERQRLVESILSSVGPGYTMDTISRININRGYTTSSNANANANASANASARAVKKGKGVAKRGREGTTPRSESEIEESLSEADREVISIWRSVEGFDISEADVAALVVKLRTEFPDIDILGESKAWAARKISEPITRRSRPSGQLWNWMKLARDFAQQRREGKPSGQRNSRLPSTGPGSGRGRLPTDEEREDSVGGPLR
jgi:hypothetical protein